MAEETGAPEAAADTAAGWRRGGTAGREEEKGRQRLLDKNRERKYKGGKKICAVEVGIKTGEKKSKPGPRAW